MSNENELKTYELAYHLSPNLEETDVKLQVQEISDLITRNQGSILSSKEPERCRLSYPIHHKQLSYFGVFEFTAPSEAIEKINAQAKLQNNILRFLLIKKPSNKSGLRVLGAQKTERTKPRAQESQRQTGKKAETEAAAGKAKMTGKETRPEEEIEKEIEEVIRGL
jgi:small subunit ribosomal protein S6